MYKLLVGVLPVQKMFKRYRVYCDIKMLTMLSSLFHIGGNWSMHFRVPELPNLDSERGNFFKGMYNRGRILGFMLV